MRQRVLALFLLGLVPLAAASRSGILADYAGTIREERVRADKHYHLNTPALIEKLGILHANTYFYLVHGAVDWEDLTSEFLPAARKAKLDVWLYFVPPSECADCSLPFGKDYVRTGAEIARLSLTYQNLKGWSIDDFADNLTLFTPEYIGRLREAGRAVNPKFLFYPLLYCRSMQAEFLDKYAPVIDGVIMAYRDEPTINTSRNSSLREQLDAAEALLSARGKALILMIYCSPLGRIPIPPGVEYVRESVAAALGDIRGGKLAGVVTYQLMKRGPAPASENYAHSGRGRVTILASGRNIEEGGFGEISRSISIGSEPAACALGFWYTVLYSRMPPGYWFLQILLDDRVVWERDIAAVEPKPWKQERVDLSGPLAGKRISTLRFRLASKRKVSSATALIGFDDLTPEGFAIPDQGFENPTGWHLTQTGPAFMPIIQVFDPQRPIRMFEAVRDLYSATR